MKDFYKMDGLVRYTKIKLVIIKPSEKMKATSPGVGCWPMSTTTNSDVNVLNFINRNIGVLSGRLLSLEGVNKTFIFWMELSSVRLRDHFVSQTSQSDHFVIC